MVTPVHRFQQIDSVQQQPQSSRHPRPPPYNVCREPETTRVEVDSSVYLEGPVEPPHVQPPNAKFRCGIWASFALAAIFVGGAKYYFDHQSTGMEVLLTCTSLVMLLYLAAGCAMSKCRDKPGATPPPQPPPTSPPLSRIQLLPPPPPPILDPEAPPPPYHIAISLPQSITPPPSYEKAVTC